ncbi:MAG TPA: sugar ABC transporter ATP-binding protein [Devosiaceae bacterium]
MNAPAQHEVIMRAEKVGKVYPGTVALWDVDFEVRRGAVNVLVGENGAGKSTLMKILAGAEQPTNGRLLLKGEPVSFGSVREAAAKGIGIVFQELNLCPNLSIAENLFLVDSPKRFGIEIDRRRQVEEARKLLARLEHPMDPNMLVGDLRIGQQQIVEIAKALAADVEVLIMDEPTSALSSSEVEILFRVIDDLKAQGVAVIYISHRLEEIMRIGDYVTVLRDGRRQDEAQVKDISIDWMIRKMVGPEGIVPDTTECTPGAELLKITDLTLPRSAGGFAVDHVTFSVRAGEVVGIYGLLGAGRSELFECLMGMHSHVGGRVVLGEDDLSHASTARRLHRGLTLVPEDRQRAGLVQSMSVADNMTLASLNRFAKFFSLDLRRQRESVKEMIKRMTVKVSSPDIEVTALSGGNQQKVVIGKSLMIEPRVILLDEPSRGIDVGAKAEVFRAMRHLAKEGLGVLFATSDLKEILGVADRILVMSRGKLTGEFLREEATEAAIIEASTATEMMTPVKELEAS